MKFFDITPHRFSASAPGTRRMLAVALAALLLLGAAPQAAHAGPFELGLKMYSQGDYAMAARYFQQATNQNATDPNAHYYLADSYLKLNRLAEAQAQYQKILAIAPDSQAARLSRVGLAKLRAYVDTPRSEGWKYAGGSGPTNGEDRYRGPVGEDHYLDEVTDNGKVVRWALTRMPLKVYIEEKPQGIRNFQPAFPAQVRRAMDVWVNAMGQQVSYVLVDTKEQADLRVSWVNTIDTKGHNADGGTAYTAGLTIPSIRADQLQFMDVKIATFDIEGSAQTSDIIYAVAVHELGHALGLLGHSENPQDIMYAQNQNVANPSRRDINTLRKLYTYTADVNNLPADARPKDAKRQAELARKLDESILKMEEQAKKDGMALTWLNLGATYIQKAKEVQKTAGDPSPWLAKALDATNTALKKEPNDPRAHHKRSLIYQEMGDYNAALTDIRKAISLDRSEPEYYMLQSWFLAKLGNTAQARASLDTYLLYKPSAANSPDVIQIKEALAGR